ncbi:CRAL/TRIO domain-containing protein [Lentithecium fluviatile CBS 122367]|uniref:Phosphatidylinositol transfer protein SFH5 n=1 Tax=Lentithecium fluviatile CBS 122367 TaxID=1168545 RepID=A0A6G1IJG8_9PLEO|nr:CRAL/TRIO domain-containing protein [Lentithecium fluviatile CBS 122367]
MTINPDDVAAAPVEAVPAPVEKQSESASAPIAAEKESGNVEAEKPKSEDPTTAPTEALSNLNLSEKKTEDATAADSSTPVPAPQGPSTDTKPAPSPSSGPVWPETPADHPLTKFFSAVPDLVQEASHDEVYGIKLSPTAPFRTKLILQKFLRANQNDLEKAKQQLLETLQWRKEFDPSKAVGETFAKERFDGLGYILEIEGVPESPNRRDVATFNVYGAVKDNQKTFGDLEAFLRWRVGLMERSIQKLNLSAATTPIPNYNEGPDPYQGFQIHDYLQVSFLRQDPVVKAATKRTIEILGRYYPETLSRKFFVNVPVIMGWLYQATKLIVAKETAKKFTVLSYGNQLGLELGRGMPKVYGGEAGELKDVGEAMGLE